MKKLICCFFFLILAAYGCDNSPKVDKYQLERENQERRLEADRIIRDAEQKRILQEQTKHYPIVSDVEFKTDDNFDVYYCFTISNVNSDKTITGILLKYSDQPFFSEWAAAEWHNLIQEKVFTTKIKSGEAKSFSMKVNNGYRSAIGDQDRRGLKGNFRIVDFKFK